MCDYSPEETTYHWDGAGGPLGDTGLLGWTPISHHVGTGAADAPECRIHPFYNAGEQASGLTSYYPGGTNGCHDGGHDLLVTRSQELWGPVSFTYNAMGGNGGSATAGADENNVAAGFMGAALRRVSDGTYVASARHPCTGGCAGQLEQVVMTETGNSGEKYTIDFIDNFSGGWVRHLVLTHVSPYMHLSLVPHPSPQLTDFPSLHLGLDARQRRGHPPGPAVLRKYNKHFHHNLVSKAL